jgi:hypothetical protein
MARSAKTTKQNGNGANLGFEATLWAAADDHQEAAPVLLLTSPPRSGERRTR